MAFQALDCAQLFGVWRNTKVKFSESSIRPIWYQAYALTRSCKKFPFRASLGQPNNDILIEI